MFITGRNGIARSSSAEDMKAFFGPHGKLGSKDLQCVLDTAAEKDVLLPTAEYVRDRIEDVFLARDESRPADAPPLKK
jgi:hypothetical protein